MNTKRHIKARLDEAAAVIKLSTLALGILWWLVTCLGAWLALCLLDNLLRLPAGLRLPLAVAGGGLVAVGLFRRVLWPAAHRRKAERAAVSLEKDYGVPDNLLISACQLEALSLRPVERLFADRTVEASSQALGRIPRSALWRGRRLRHWSLAAAAVLSAWALYAALFPRQSANALARYIMPLGDIPPAGSMAIALTPAGDVTVCEGDDLDVAVALRRTGPPPPNTPDRAAPPLIVWTEGSRPVTSSKADNENALMQARPHADDDAAPSEFRYVFRNVQRTFSFRVLASDTYSRAVSVTVLPMPRLTTSLFRLTPPPYTGLPPRETPGPPAAISGLPGSRLEIEFSVRNRMDSARWELNGDTVTFQPAGNTWNAVATLQTAGSYTIEAVAMNRQVVLGTGDAGIEADRLPEIEFVTENRNRFVTPGDTLELDIQASDDYGIRDISVVSRPATDGTATTPPTATPHKTWTYLGPPGNTGPIKESVTIALDPDSFVPGETYLVEARCHDFRPGAPAAVSKPIVLRVKSWRDLQIADTDPLAEAFALLRKTIVEQKRANDLTDNMRTHLAEVLDGKHLPMHRDGIAKQQTKARDTGREAGKRLPSDAPDARVIGDRLAGLVEQEMGAVLDKVAELSPDDPARLASRAGRVADQQAYILNALIELLGRVARAAAEPTTAKPPESKTETPQATLDDNLAQLADDIDAFTREQKRVINRSMSLMDKAPEDLTDAEEDILGELAREEAKWANFFEEKLTDFGKLPQQDFADGSLASEFNEIIQDMQKAAAALYQKNIELAVPLEQSGLEKAEELVHNLEKWLADRPDNIKWNMEEPDAPADIPMAELPTELEDMIGELLDDEDNMSEDVEDVSSSWMDSLDKGAGWGTMDGPISDMSAKGVTGNLLPNQMEIGGRSGEGRTGRSHGQMVEESAEGKGGRETPTRLTPSPFEQGSVEDSSRSDTGGATGGGKLSGYSEEGLLGPPPPPMAAKLARLAGQQATIRQQAQDLSLKLRRYNLPSGDMEVSVSAMKQLEDAARKANGLGVRQAHSRVLDALDEARRAVRAEAGLHRELSRLPESARRELMTGLHENTPRGYEEMVAEYFRHVAEGSRPGETVKGNR